MKKKIPDIEGSIEKRTIDTDQLRAMLQCGRKTATDIGTAAGARIQIGRSVLWNVRKVEEYLDSLSGGD